MLVDQTNSYAASKNKIGDVSDNEKKCFISILLLSGHMSVSRRMMFWEGSKDYYNELVASSLSRDRFEFIMTHLHCCDNENLDDAERTSLYNMINERLAVTIMSPTNANSDLTDEDSVDEENVTISYLPATQLQVEASIVSRRRDDCCEDIT
ncbi:hypothetical protein PR048_005428 [Dryococelus australis]|uniref:PiggyBac transposable element-derived protein domain-containing protein n=1 Tax=Dryococelus australis TaxID=614101 RepID=A0ABQ9I844_9NEOP|nr:hypothetical protein PR048_005428 [Dryococelus australis]